MRKVVYGGSSTDPLLGQADHAVSVWRKNAFILVFSLRGNADVGLEVREREYILLRRLCGHLHTSSIINRDA